MTARCESPELAAFAAARQAFEAAIGEAADAAHERMDALYQRLSDADRESLDSDDGRDAEPFPGLRRALTLRDGGARVREIVRAAVALGERDVLARVEAYRTQLAAATLVSRCVAPVDPADAGPRAYHDPGVAELLCGDDAPTTRSIAAGIGDERIEMHLCAAHAAELDEETTWHEAVKAAAIRLYGSSCGAEIDAVDLDDYRGMLADEAIVAIVAAYGLDRRAEEASE